MSVDARQIRLNSIEVKDGNTFVYHYEMGSYLKRFLSEEPLWVRYEGSVEKIPPGIAAIPFLGLLSNLVRFYGGTIDIPQLDRVYAESMERVTAAFSTFYPSLHLAGKVNIDERTETLPCAGNRTCQLFTGGIDSLATVLTHQSEDPLLISIWGADIRLHQPEIWRRVDAEQSALARHLGLQRTVIASNYFDILQLWALDVYFPGKLARGWYVEVGYGSIFLGLAAPLAWREGIGTFYFASSFLAVDHALDGSHPLLVEKIAWPGTRVVYDGSEESRQAKIERISRTICQEAPGLKFPICTVPRESGNCSVCEKCSRTMSGLALAGVDPVRHGFVVTADTPAQIRQALETSRWEMAYSTFWREIQVRVPACRETAVPQWRDFFDWLSGADLDGFIRNRPVPRLEKERRIIKSLLPVDFLRWLRKWKFRLQEAGDETGR